MARRVNHVCFSCGSPTETTIQTKQRRGMTYICSETRCWNLYYKENT